MKRLLILLPVIATLVAVVGASPAHAAYQSPTVGQGTKLTNGDALWTESKCAAGRHTHTWPIDDHAGAYLMTYVTNGRVCAFLSYPRPTAHDLMVYWVSSTGWVSYDRGLYSSYAGALAAPAGECRLVHAELATSTGTYYSEGDNHSVCG